MSLPVNHNGYDAGTTESYQSVFMGTPTGGAPALMQYVAAVAYKHCSKQAVSNTPTF